MRTRTPPEMDPRLEQQLLVFRLLVLVEVEDVLDFANGSLSHYLVAPLGGLLPPVGPFHLELASEDNTWRNVVPSDVIPLADGQGRCGLDGGRGVDDGRSGRRQWACQKGESGARDVEPHRAG